MKNKDVQEKLNKAFQKIEVKPDFDDMIRRKASVVDDIDTHQSKKSWRLPRLVPALSIIALAIVFIFRFATVNPLPSEYLSLDINPSFEFVFTDDDFEIKAVNDDAKELLARVDVENKELDEVLDMLIIEAYNEGYLTKENKEEILITANEGNDYIDLAKTSLLNTLTENEITATINAEAVEITKTSLDEASKLNISLGRYEVIKEVAKKTNTSIDSLVKENITKILEITEMNDLEVTTFYSNGSKNTLNKYRNSLLKKNDLLNEIDNLSLDYELEEISLLDYEKNSEQLKNELANTIEDIAKQKQLLSSENLNLNDLLNNLVVSDDALIALENQEIKLEVAYEKKALSSEEYNKQINLIKDKQKLAKLEKELIAKYQTANDEQITEIIDYQKNLNSLRTLYKTGDISKTEYKDSKIINHKKLEVAINSLKKSTSSQADHGNSSQNSAEKVNPSDQQILDSPRNNVVKDKEKSPNGNNVK